MKPFTNGGAKGLNLSNKCSVSAVFGPIYVGNTMTSSTDLFQQFLAKLAEEQYAPHAGVSSNHQNTTPSGSAAPSTGKRQSRLLVPSAPNSSQEGKEGSGTNTRLLPISKWKDYHDWPPEGGLRHLVFYSQTNGFDKVIRRIGRRVLIDEAAFFAWAEKQGAHHG